MQIAQPKKSCIKRANANCATKNNCIKSANRNFAIRKKLMLKRNSNYEIAQFALRFVHIPALEIGQSYGCQLAFLSTELHRP